MSETIRHLPLTALRVSASNTRKDTSAGQEDSSLQGLALSIKQHGLLNPLTVHQAADGMFDIIAGQRRYLACKELGLATVPVIVREPASDASAVALSVVENLQRADMHPLDKAKAFDELR
jgi:ParB family chromosome partitioning protein